MSCIYSKTQYFFSGFCHQKKLIGCLSAARNDFIHDYVLYLIFKKMFSKIVKVHGSIETHYFTARQAYK